MGHIPCRKSTVFFGGGGVLKEMHQRVLHLMKGSFTDNCLVMLSGMCILYLYVYIYMGNNFDIGMPIKFTTISQRLY